MRVLYFDTKSDIIDSIPEVSGVMFRVIVEVLSAPTRLIVVPAMTSLIWFVLRVMVLPSRVILASAPATIWRLLIFVGSLNVPKLRLEFEGVSVRSRFD